MRFLRPLVRGRPLSVPWSSKAFLASFLGVIIVCAGIIVTGEDNGIARDRRAAKADAFPGQILRVRLARRIPSKSWEREVLGHLE
jgi:hypothetical protein